MGGTAWRRRAGSLAAETEHLPRDAGRMAASLGVRVTVAPLPPSLWGMTVGHSDVTVNASLRKGDAKFALAHELGHVLLRRARSPEVGTPHEEPLCDEFARVVLTRQGGTLPAWLRTWNKLVTIGASDDHRVVGRVVVCGRCGPRRQEWPCRCHVARSALLRRDGGV